MTSKTPSVARTKKRSFSESGKMLISGSAMERRLGCLKYKSPSDRVIARPWYSRRADLLMEPGLVEAATRQQPRTWSTSPPWRSMRFLSSMRVGLWSSETATACPARHKTARESPTFAITRRNAVPSFGLPWISAVKAVDPTSSNFFRSAVFRISLSVWLKASLTATFIFSSRDAGCTCFCRNWFMMFLCKCLAAWSATCVPPCPSNTAK
mmetsp:Transcript_23181/g.64768  ORF Transcript_23181/g.64768 Transcript_23181/m.64768 type:complete len:210 (+) Transcript_23181:356-985(+)